MKRFPFVTLLLCMIACNSADKRAPARGGPAGSASVTARKEPKLDLSAPRLGSLVPSASVDGAFGEHGGAFALQWAGKAKLLTDGKVLVCEGPRLLRLTAEGRPDASFGRRGAIGFPGTDLECIDVLPMAGGDAYLVLGPSSHLASRRIVKMSSSGELVELVPDREVGRLATDGDGRLVELRDTKEHGIYMDTLAPEAASVKLDAERKDWILAFALVGERPLVWPSHFFSGEKKPDDKLMRFIPSGQPDKTFATAGIFRFPTRCKGFEGVLGLRDGRLLVASRGCIAILDARGGADTRFGQNGILELGSEDAPVELPDGRIALTSHVERTDARLVTLTPNGKRTDTTLLKGPVVSTRIAGVDASGRVLVNIGVHHYVTERTTDQETVMVMTRP